MGVRPTRDEARGTKHLIGVLFRGCALTIQPMLTTARNWYDAIRQRVRLPRLSSADNTVTVTIILVYRSAENTDNTILVLGQKLYRCTAMLFPLRCGARSAASMLLECAVLTCADLC